MVCNTAVFYDIENLIGVFSSLTNTTLQLDEIYRRIMETEGVRGVSIQKAYADWAVPVNRNLRNFVLQIGIEPVQIFNTNQNDKVKNAADVSLIIDAVELLSKRPDIENYVIVSGDGIFAFLSKKLHEYGKRVIGCGFERNSNIIFRNACDYYISLEKSDKSLTATSRKTKRIGPSAVARATAVNEAAPLPIPVKSEEEPIKKIPRRFPKSKFTESLAEANLDVWKVNESNINESLLVLRDVINALFSKETEETAEMEISVFKTYVDHYVPGFKISQYKFKRFRDFIIFLLTGSPFCVYEAGSNIFKITRRDHLKDKNRQVNDKSGLIITLSDGVKLKSIFDISGNSNFIYTLASNDVKPIPKQKRQIKQKTVKPMEAAPPEPIKELISIDEGSVRKWIKNSFDVLSTNNKLPVAEVRRMLTPEYTQKTFGIKTPILREVLTRSNLQEQRTINGKVKYWKETFKFNNKTYLVYKEWNASLHRERFIAWLEKFQ